MLPNKTLLSPKYGTVKYTAGIESLTRAQTNFDSFRSLTRTGHF